MQFIHFLPSLFYIIYFIFYFYVSNFCFYVNSVFWHWTFVKNISLHVVLCMVVCLIYIYFFLNLQPKKQLLNLGLSCPSAEFSI